MRPEPRCASGFGENCESEAGRGSGRRGVGRDRRRDRGRRRRRRTGGVDAGEHRPDHHRRSDRRLARGHEAGPEPARPPGDELREQHHLVPALLSLTRHLDHRPVRAQPWRDRQPGAKRGRLRVAARPRRRAPGVDGSRRLRHRPGRQVAARLQDPRPGPRLGSVQRAHLADDDLLLRLRDHRFARRQGLLRGGRPRLPDRRPDPRLRVALHPGARLRPRSVLPSRLLHRSPLGTWPRPFRQRPLREREAVRVRDGEGEAGAP